MTDTDCHHEFSYWSEGMRICQACEAALEHRPTKSDVQEIMKINNELREIALAARDHVPPELLARINKAVC